MKFLFALCMLVSSIAFGSGSVRVGNGGIGQRVGPEILLLDIAKTDARDFAPIVTRDAWTQAYGLAPAEEALQLPPHGLAGLLSNIERAHPTVGRKLARLIGELKWKSIEHGVPVTLDTAELFTSEKEIVRLAGRIGRTVYLYRNLISQMPAFHRAALGIHEAVFATYPMNCRDRFGCIHQLEPMAIRARDMTKNVLLKNSPQAEAVEEHFCSMDLDRPLTWVQAWPRTFESFVSATTTRASGSAGKSGSSAEASR